MVSARSKQYIIATQFVTWLKPRIIVRHWYLCITYSCPFWRGCVQIFVWPAYCVNINWAYEGAICMPAKLSPFFEMFQLFMGSKIDFMKSLRKFYNVKRLSVNWCWFDSWCLLKQILESADSSNHCKILIHKSARGYLFYEMNIHD